MFPKFKFVNDKFEEIWCAIIREGYKKKRIELFEKIFYVGTVHSNWTKVYSPRSCFMAEECGQNQAGVNYIGKTLLKTLQGSRLSHTITTLLLLLLLCYYIVMYYSAVCPPIVKPRLTIVCLFACSFFMCLCCIEYNNFCRLYALMVVENSGAR